MGCNFYSLEGEHIGKRSAAGMYCWNCGITLCKGGNSDIHSGYSEWHDACPKCGETRTKEPDFSGSVGRELGFNKEPFGPKTGVKSCSSFSWAIYSDRIDEFETIVDEYGREYTAEEFQAVLSECPVRFFDSIGVDFS